MAQDFSIELTKTAYSHIEALRRYERNRILDGIKEQLTHGPAQETRNRKRLRENPLSDWELRIQPFRVFYEVDEARRFVRVLAVGVKEHNRLTIGGEEVEI